MALAYGGMSPGTNRKPKPKPKPEGEDKGLFGGYDPISVIVDVGKNILRSGQKDSPKAPKPSAARSGKPARNSGAYPGVGAKAREAASKAQEQATAYSKYQREANKLKRKIKANSGPTDLAGRTQRALDLKRMRGIQKEADRRKKLAQDLGLRMGGGTGGGNPSGGGSPSGGGGGGGSSSGGGTAAGNAVAKATSGGSTPKAKTATKVGTVLAAARKQKQDTMGTPITAKELANFMAFYDKTHEGTLSRSDAVLMARMLKRKSPAIAKKYGLNVAQEN